MRTTATVLLILFVACSAADADVRVRHHAHTDGYYYGGTTTSAEDLEYEVWMGDGMLSYIRGQRKLIFDREAQLLTYVNMSDSTYIETAVPFEWSDLIVEEEYERLMRFQTTGEMGTAGDPPAPPVAQVLPSGPGRRADGTGRLTVGSCSVPGPRHGPGTACR